MLPAALLALLGSGAAPAAGAVGAGATGAGAAAGGGIANLAPQLMGLMGGSKQEQPVQQPAYVQQTQSKGLQGLGKIMGIGKVLGIGA